MTVSHKKAKSIERHDNENSYFHRESDAAPSNRNARHNRNRNLIALINELGRPS